MRHEAAFAGPPGRAGQTGQSARPGLEVRVINLASAERRRAWMQDELAGLAHPWSFFEAHTNLANPRLRHDPARIRGTYGRALSPAQLALWSSHYTVIADFAETGASDYLLVFEDDVIFDTGFPLDELMVLCRDEGIHYMRLFGMYYAPGAQLGFFHDRSIIRYRTSPSGAQAYLLSKEGARRVAETCRQVDTAWDLALDAFWKTGLPLYSVYPFPALERFSPTSVPMLDIEPLGPVDHARFLRRRLGNRLGKALANWRLRGRDRAMRGRAADFHQVGAPEPGAGGSV
ncbi:glycosyltransferase family 25 protein [Marinibacterium sp. SX1]|uniref:glycosyltransferase family 25 protein n=1 Tax=Marinibacterium sp. SX1 TaxID=3388424 RepID=UPI003D176436